MGSQENTSSQSLLKSKVCGVTNVYGVAGVYELAKSEKKNRVYEVAVYYGVANCSKFTYQVTKTRSENFGLNPNSAVNYNSVNSQYSAPLLIIKTNYHETTKLHVRIIYRKTNP